MLTKIIYRTPLLIMLLFLSSCEKDNPIIPPVINLETGAELLQYLESEGDYVNKNSIPLISADELYSQRDSVIIIDIRSAADYSLGHIENSLNLSGSVIIDSLLYFPSVKKIVIVSGTGEASAYYTLLLHLSGFSNVYTLNFGMASWNSYFSDIWLNRITNYSGSSYYSTEPVEKIISYQLPDPVLEEGNKSTKEKLLLKVRSMLAFGFEEAAGSTVQNTSVEFESAVKELDKYYIVCAGPKILYYSQLFGTYHLIGAANYLLYPYVSDFRSAAFLQSLPDKSKILVYSGSGQESAFITAYLRLLGYNAVSLLLGCNSFAHTMLSFHSSLQPYQFNTNVIRNYPYVR